MTHSPDVAFLEVVVKRTQVQTLRITLSNHHHSITSRQRTGNKRQTALPSHPNLSRPFECCTLSLRTTTNAQPHRRVGQGIAWKRTKHACGGGSKKWNGLSTFYTILSRHTGWTGAVCALAAPPPAPGSMPPIVSPNAAAPADTDVVAGFCPIAAATCSSASFRCSS